LHIVLLQNNKGKKRRDGSPDKSSTPSIPCEGIQQDAEGQKRPIVNDEILALHITEDDLVKVSSILKQKLNLFEALCVCLSVCQSVCRITQKVVNELW